MNHRTARPLLAVLLLVFAGAGCSSDDDDSDSFVVRTTTVSTYEQTPIAIAGRWLAFLAAEDTTGPGGTNFNGPLDLDKNDRIAVVVDTSSRIETNLGVAVAWEIEEPLAWAGDHLYLVVDEAQDTRDWNLDGDQANPDDLVLLHWTSTVQPPVLTYVDDLVPFPSAGERPLSAVGTNLYYTSATAAPAAAGESSLRMIAAADPLNPVAVPTQDLVGPIGPTILGVDEGLLFLSLDETDFGGRQLNGDGDAGDAFVLALFDAANATITAGVPTKSIRNVGLALDDPLAPRRAKKVATADWQVGFLVSEAGEGESLNDLTDFSANWQPVQCGLVADADDFDRVLHYLSFLAWEADPIVDAPRNTGLVGMKRVAIANGFVATISPEDEAGCDLNDNGSQGDAVVRWTEIVAPGSPILPPRDAAVLRAVAGIHGGTEGLAELDNRFVIVVSETGEGEDINGDGNPFGKTFNLVAHLQPTASQPNAQWDFTHGSGGVYAGASWLGETPDRARLGMGFEERVIDGNPGTNDNLNGPGSSSGTPTADDPDLDDAIATFPDTSGSTLTFPGVPIALATGNGGIVVARSYGFYRVSEAEDSRDWNGDGDESDFVLFRTSLNEGTSSFMAPIDSDLGPAVYVNGSEASPSVVALLTDEQAISGGQNADVNGDGDGLDVVLRYFRF